MHVYIYIHMIACTYMAMKRNMDLRIYAVILVVFVDFRAGGVTPLLSYDFYDQSCPELESIVRAGVRSFSLADPTTPSALLRLMFHDCQVQGCDASILLEPDGPTAKYSEIGSSKNFGIRKRDVINFIKSTVEAVCPQKVSCSDIIIMAAREGVALSGGPRIDVPLGRKDSSNPPNVTLADASLPPADIGVEGVLGTFAKHGMSVEESVAILGSHTLGVTHCVNLKNRLYGYQPSTPGNALLTDPVFVSTLKLRCPREGTSRISFVQNDFTSIIFDNQYFVNSMNGFGVLKIDAQMPLDSRTRPFMEKFASDEAAFFEAFSTAFVKMSSSNVLAGGQGVIRRSCDGL